MVDQTSPVFDADERQSKRRAFAHAPSRRFARRCGAAFVIGALAVGVGVGTFGLPVDTLTPSASAVVANTPPNVGHGYSFVDNQGVSHWLGANTDPTAPGGLTWCIELGPTPPNTSAEMVNARDLADTDHRSDTDAALAVNSAQMAYILMHHQAEDTDDNRAAISMLMHANFDIKANAASVVAQAAAKYPTAYQRAKDLAAEAIRNTPQSATYSYDNPDAKRTGSIKDIQLKTPSGTLVPGVTVTLTLKGPAVFDETGTNTWTGTTASQPLTVKWTATGTGKVTYSGSYRNVAPALRKIINGSDAQDVLLLPNSDPEDMPMQPGEFTAHYDFQPMATSNVGKVDSKVIDNDTNVIKDSIHVEADKSYTQSPNWMYDTKTGEYVPVVFEGTAYYVGDVPGKQSKDIPAGAKVVGKTTVTAKGPGDYTAEIKVDHIDPKFITWVWAVKKADQGKYASYIAADKSEDFSIPDETTSKQERVKIDSTLQSNVTRSGTYLVDNLYVSGFDKDHTEFEGGAGFKADVDEMEQTLYFFPEDLDVTDANLSKATKIASVKVPAKNGYYDRVGANEFKMLDDNPIGTYVFVTSFAGDDRTEAYTSPVTDTHEQITVPREKPEVKTTATDKADGDKTLAGTGDVTISDKVCQVKGKGLRPGKEYTLTATAMDKVSGKAILDKDGKPYTGTAKFTPKDENDCGIVDVTIPASALWGKTVVMFEDVKLDGKTVALHTDINDNDQTVKGGENPGLGTTLTDKTDGDHKVNPGPVELVDQVCPKTDDTFKVGETYTVTGTLMDKATGKPITGADGKEITSTVTYTPKDVKDCANVTFKFDTSSLGGHDVVAFEKALDAKGTLIATHEDINDGGQTVHVETPALAKTGANAVGITLAAAASLIGAGAMSILARRRRATSTIGAADDTTAA